VDPTLFHVYEQAPSRPAAPRPVKLVHVNARGERVPDPDR